MGSSLLSAGVYVEREKAAPAVGINFTFETKVLKILHAIYLY